MRIDLYSFGSIIIDGKGYASDVRIYPDKIEDWWRREGHAVYREDIEDIMEKRPAVLIIGTGAYSRVRVMQEVFDYAKERNIKLIIKPTKGACEEYNKLSKTQTVIAALHLTY